jgi:hypothetical protein
MNGPIILRLIKGTYVGGGCPDKAARVVKHLGHPCAGFPYDGEHAAQPGEEVHVLDEVEAERLVRSGTFQRVEQ